MSSPTPSGTSVVTMLIALVLLAFLNGALFMWAMSILEVGTGYWDSVLLALIFGSLTQQASFRSK